MTGPRSDVALTGADCFLRAFDHEIQRMNGARHLSQLVLRLGPGLDTGVLEKLVQDIAREQPIVRAPIDRRLGIGAPVYRLARGAQCPMPEIQVHEAGAPAAESLPPLFAERLNQPRSLRAGELLRFDLVRYAGGAAGTDLAMTWLHMLFDGSGSEAFLRWLDACYRGESSPSELPDPAELDPAPPAVPSLRERGERARAWQHWIDGFAAAPPHSLAGPLRRTRQALRYERMRFDAAQSQAIAERAKARAGFLTPMLFYLAAAIRGHHAVHRARGTDPGHYLVPLPVNRRPRGREGAIFRTHVSLLWFHVPASLAERLPELLEELKAQRLAAIRAGHVEGGSFAMDFARFAPRRLYSHMARRGFGGELCSFFFAYTGEFLGGLERFLGCELLDGFHVAPVPPSPGSCLALSYRGGRLNVTHAFQDGVLSEGERALFRESLRADLLG